MNWSENLNNILKSIDKTLHTRGGGSRKLSDGSVCRVVFKDIDYKDVESSQHLQSTVSTITIGSGFNLVDMVIEYCIQSMNLSEESTFNFKHDLLKLKFTAILESCFFKPNIIQMRECQKLSLAYWFKEHGVQLFKNNKLFESFHKFKRSLQYLVCLNIHYPQLEENISIKDDIDLDEVMDLMINVYNNMALIHLHLKHFDSVIAVSSFSIELKPNIKALYRRACAFTEKNEYEEAENDLNKALKLDSSNKAVMEKLTVLREKDKNNREKYKETMKKMFA